MTKFKVGDTVYHKRNYAVGIVEEGCFEPYFSCENGCYYLVKFQNPEIKFIFIKEESLELVDENTL